MAHRRPSTRWLALPLTLLLAAFVASGCGGDGNGNGDGEDTAEVRASVTRSDEPVSGNVTVCMGRDTSGVHGPLLEAFSDEHPDATARLVELPESADEQRSQLVQRRRPHSSECDVMALDVIWTAEFAAQEWLLSTSDFIEDREDEFIASTLATAEYRDEYWAVPFNSNAGFLYWRTDQVDELPQTWQDVYESAAATDGIVYQGSRYEGLTVNFLELLYAAGGDVLSEDGESATADSDEVREVLQFMVDGIRDGAAPRATLTYMEEEARRAFESGRATYARNWPYAYSLGQDVQELAGNFEVAPFPEWEGGTAASVLGGYNLAVSAFSENPQGAAALIDYLTSEDVQVTYAENATPSVLTDVYEMDSVREELPFAEALLTAIEQGRSRPVSPVYPQVSQAIYDNVYAALTGDVDVDRAASDMQSSIERALATF
jgi:multiple sugar transport system substrate-binding protein